ncbi:hypothetical protein HDU76_011854, partial [Blyttiomyces sp. JEL0837]
MQHQHFQQMGNPLTGTGGGGGPSSTAAALASLGLGLGGAGSGSLSNLANGLTGLGGLGGTGGYVPADLLAGSNAGLGLGGGGGGGQSGVNLGMGGMGLNVGVGGGPMHAGVNQRMLQQQQQQMDEEKVYSLILELTNPATREQALLELSKKREAYDGLAPILWHTFGVMTALIQEVVMVYRMLDPPTLTVQASNRVCNALALFQCVASHNDTRVLFLNSHIPLFLYPFLNTNNKTRPFEYLRLTSLGVIGALVK